MVIKHWSFIVMILIVTPVYVLQRIGVILPRLVNNYLNDLLSIPLTLCLILTILKWRKGNHYLLPISMISIVVLYYSFYFEYYLPQYQPRYTADYLDILCYVLGGFLFYLQQRFVLPKV